MVYHTGKSLKKNGDKKALYSFDFHVVFSVYVSAWSIVRRPRRDSTKTVFVFFDFLIF